MLCASKIALVSSTCHNVFMFFTAKLAFLLVLKVVWPSDDIQAQGQGNANPTGDGSPGDE